MVSWSVGRTMHESARAKNKRSDESMAAACSRGTCAACTTRRCASRSTSATRAEHDEGNAEDDEGGASAAEQLAGSWYLTAEKPATAAGAGAAGGTSPALGLTPLPPLAACACLMAAAATAGEATSAELAAKKRSRIVRSDRPRASVPSRSAEAVDGGFNDDDTNGDVDDNDDDADGRSAGRGAERSRSVGRMHVTEAT